MKSDNNLLTATERIRLMFFREFGPELAQDAMDFVANRKGAFASLKRNDTITIVPEDAEEGVYFCLKDGTAVKYDGQESMENVSHIGIIYGSMKFGVQLEDKGSYKLYSNYERCPENADYYTENGKSCHEEYDFIEATKRLKRIGTDIPLADNEYMPLVRQWDIMGMFKSQLQKAILAAGGEPIRRNCWYWSISEYSRYGAWGVSFSDGGTTYGSLKSNSYRVRAVVAF